jgi:hypothetical protein
MGLSRASARAPVGPIGLVEPRHRAGADGTRNGDARRAGPAGTAIGTIAREFRGTPSPRLTILLRSDDTEAIWYVAHHTA